MHINPEAIETNPAGTIFPLSLARAPIAADSVVHVASAKKVPILYVGFPIRLADTRRSTAIADETIKLVLLPFLKYAVNPAANNMSAKR